MPDYREMYFILFRETSKAISALQRAQQETEALYVSDSQIDRLIVIKPDPADSQQENKAE